MLQKLKNLVREEEGQAVTEYGLIIGLVVVGVVALMATIGDELVEVFTSISNQIQNR
jgi:pilus assembly protein Flp/PilA